MQHYLLDAQLVESSPRSEQTINDQQSENGRQNEYVLIEIQMYFG